MTDKQVQGLLSRANLTERESLIYISLLKNTEDTILGIHKKTKIPRSSLYQILKLMEERSLISHYKVNKTIKWTCNSLKNLESDIEEKKDNLAKALPFLMSMRSHDFFQNDSVRLFTGKDGFKSAWEEVILDLEQNNEPFVYAIANEDIFKYLPRYFPKWVERRKKNKTFAKLIFPIGHTYAPDLSSEQIKYINEKFLPSGDVTFYGGSKVVISTFTKRKISCAIIESQEIYKIFFGLFSYIWENES